MDRNRYSMPDDGVRLVIQSFPSLTSSVAEEHEENEEGDLLRKPLINYSQNQQQQQNQHHQHQNPNEPRKLSTFQSISNLQFPARDETPFVKTLRDVLSHVGVGLVQIAIAFLYIVMKFVGKDITDGLIFSGLRTAISIPAMALIVLIFDRTIPDRRTMMLCLCQGFLVLVASVLTVLAVFFTTATNVALINPVIPVLTAALATILKWEKSSILKWLGVLLVFAGVLIMCRIDQFTLSGDLGKHFIGLGMALLSACITSVCFIFKRYILITSKLSSFTVTGLAVLESSIMIGIPAYFTYYWFGPSSDFSLIVLTWQDWLGLIYSATFPYCFTFVIIGLALQRLSATIVALYSAMVPIVTALLSFFILGEFLHWWDYVGGGVVLMSFALVLWVQQKDLRELQEQQKEQGNLNVDNKH